MSSNGSRQASGRKAKPYLRRHIQVWQALSGECLTQSNALMASLSRMYKFIDSNMDLLVFSLETRPLRCCIRQKHLDHRAWLNERHVRFCTIEHINFEQVRGSLLCCTVQAVHTSNRADHWELACFWMAGCDVCSKLVQSHHITETKMYTFVT